MGAKRAAHEVRVRRVVSRLEDVVSESDELSRLYGRAVDKPSNAAAMLRAQLEFEAVEVFVVLLLDGKHRVRAFAEVSRGSATTSIVHPREVFGPAVRESAVAILVAHNHPSGDPEPSTEDINVTKRLATAGTILGIPLLDHVVIGHGGTFVSLRERMEF